MLVLGKVSLHIVLATSYAFSRFWLPRLDRNAQHHLLYAIDVTRHFQGLAFSGPRARNEANGFAYRDVRKCCSTPQPSKYTTWPASGETRGPVTYVAEYCHGSILEVMGGAFTIGA